MEAKITIGSKTWIVPSGGVSSLIAWLNSNAVEVGAQKQEIRETPAINDGYVKMYLITE